MKATTGGEMAMQVSTITLFLFSIFLIRGEEKPATFVEEESIFIPPPPPSQIKYNFT